MDPIDALGKQIRKTGQVYGNIRKVSLVSFSFFHHISLETVKSNISSEKNIPSSWYISLFDFYRSGFIN